MKDLIKLGNDMARAFWCSLPSRMRPGTKAYARARLAAIRRTFRPYKFPVMEPEIRGVHRK